MQTNFTDAQRQDPAIQSSEAILRSCVHCGFCQATCPTYVLTGDELDSPRGRIYLIKDMLENDRPATPEVVRHIDRCLSCLACMTTCPSGVHYQHLVDHARRHIEATYRRSWHERWMRSFLATVLPYPLRFRGIVSLARLLRPLARWLPRRLRAAVSLAPQGRQLARRGHDSAAAAGVPVAQSGLRVAVMTGCVQSVLGSSANAATIRLLERMGCELVELSGCCGSLTHHLGREGETRQFAGDFIRQLRQAETQHAVDAIVINASGCGTHLKDYGFVFRDDAELGNGAAGVSRKSVDISEFVLRHGLPNVVNSGALRVAYHSACSLQHGQRVESAPRELLRAAGFEVLEIPEGHLCCGSAGTFNMLEPELAGQLAERKVAHIAGLDADVVAAGNLGCMTQLGLGASVPIVHTVELLDWATGGPCPEGLSAM